MYTHIYVHTQIEKSKAREERDRDRETERGEIGMTRPEANRYEDTAATTCSQRKRNKSKRTEGLEDQGMG